MRTELWRHFDFWLLGSVAVLTIFGIAMINSAIAGNEELIDQTSRQIVFAISGFLILLITAAIDYRLWTAIGRFMYIGITILLGLTFLIGGTQLGVVRWLDVGLVLIQPSEIAKIALILVLAEFFARNQSKIHDLRWVFRSFLLTLGMVFWIFIQPNLSTSIVLLVIWLALLWATGLQLKHLVLFGALGLVVAGIGFPLLEEYQQQRVFTFLFPDPEARFGANYNVNQALITIGSGGLFGQGYQQGNQVQLRFLKVRHTDFIFSALAEEFGFIGTMVILALILFVIWRILRAARLARDTYGALIAYGVATLIFFHTTVNIAMNINIIPVTGLPLPFISSGGSALISTLMGIGLVESVLLRQKSLEFQS
jgi:rod shape determining protein RodA